MEKQKPFQLLHLMLPRYIWAYSLCQQHLQVCVQRTHAHVILLQIVKLITKLISQINKENRIQKSVQLRLKLKKSQLYEAYTKPHMWQINLQITRCLKITTVYNTKSDLLICGNINTNYQIKTGKKTN
jgi:hypothetical protein